MRVRPLCSDPELAPVGNELDRPLLIGAIDTVSPYFLFQITHDLLAGVTIPRGWMLDVDPSSLL